MNSLQLDFKRVNQYLPYIFLVGMGIGTTNYIIHGEFNWLQWVIQSSSTSFLIGFTLLWVASNKSILKSFFKTKWTLYFLLLVSFFLMGMIATEVESLIKNLMFRNKAYSPFTLDNTLLSNSVISVFLGFSFFLNDQLFPPKSAEIDKEQKRPSNQEAELAGEHITKVPIKQGGHIQLIPVQDILYFEAFDNYSNLYDANGKRMLCDYSLLFLEKRLDKDFLRIHRKYIVNTNHIKQIVPHLNGRYIIQFNPSNVNTITSSKGYLQAMRKLVKIE